MQERNRTFGRVSRPVDKTSAPRQAAAKQRKPGRTKSAAAVAPKQQRGRATPLAAAKPTPVVRAAVEMIEPTAPVEAPVAQQAVVLPEAAPLEVLTAVEAAPSIDPLVEVAAPHAEPDTPRVAVEDIEADRSASIVAAPELTVAMDPLTRPTPAKPAWTARRRPVARVAVAASVAAACLLAFSHFSDAHLPTLAVVSQAAPAGVSDAAAPVAEALPQNPRIALLPTDVATLPPITASAVYGTDDLVEAATLAPALGERVTARAAAPEKADTPAARVAAPKKPGPKQLAARTGAPRPQAEAPRQQGSRGAILDFLSDLIP